MSIPTRMCPERWAWLNLKDPTSNGASGLFPSAHPFGGGPLYWCNMGKIRAKFVEAFGEEEAKAIETAAQSHFNGINNENIGSDAFRHALTIVIGFQCVEKYYDEHHIAVPFVVFKEWVRENANLASHDGSCDYLALMAGAYSPFIKES